MSKPRQTKGFLASKDGLERLTEKRREKGYSYKVIKEKAHVTLDQVKRLFNPQWGEGKYKLGREAIEAIARVLDLHPREIVGSAWEPPAVTPEPEQTDVDDINWHSVCGQVLEEQRENQRLRRKATERGFELKVHVPLGLVKRKQQQRRSGDVALNQVYQLEQEVITQTYRHEDFLKHIGLGEDKVETGKNIAITGEAGTGKTTLLEKIASEIYEKNKGLPICISLAALEGQTLEDYLLQKWLKNALPAIRKLSPGAVPSVREVTEPLKEALAEQFSEGRVWLLLDGVDEMRAKSPVKALATIWEQLTKGWLAKARVVLTCRLNVWDANVRNPLNGFETYKTLEFEQDEVKLFIRLWFAEADKQEQGEQLLTQLNEAGRERIRELVKNPLCLALLCQIWYLQPVDLPETKAALYQRFTRYLFEWKREELLTDLTDADKLNEQLNQALGKLALAGINSKDKFRLRRSLARKEMGERLFKLADKLGWLTLVDREAQTDEPVYAFFHPTFQEYFAALAISDWNFFLPCVHKDEPVEDKDNPGTYKCYRIFEPQWKEVILLWLGRQEEEVSKKQKEEFIEALVNFEDGCWDFYWYRALFLAAAGITEFKDCIYADSIVATLVKCSAETYTDTMDGRLICEAARATLLETDRTRAVNALIDELNDFIDEDARWKVFNSLVQIGTGNSEAIAALTDLMNTSADKELRQETAFFLGKINPDKREAIKFLKQQLLNTTQPNWLGLRAASFLGEIDQRNQYAINFLTQLLEHNEGLRLQAASTLGRIAPGNQDAIKTLTKFLNTDRGECLVNIPLVAACNLLQTDPDNADAIRVLRKFIAPSQDEWERVQAASSLGKTQQGKQEAIKVLLEVIHEAINTTQDQRLLQQATWSLKQIEPSIFEPSPNWSQRNFPDEGDVDYVAAQLALIKYCLRQEDDVALEESSYKLIWYLVQTTLYPTFYQACHSHPSTTYPEAPNNIPADSSPTIQALENQLLDIRFQLQPTDKIYPLWIDAQALEGETDKSAIAQEFLNQIFSAAFSDTPEIPLVNNAAQLRSWTPRIKRRLQKQNLTLILYQYEPYPELVSFCRQLASGKVFHIGWITDKPLEAPLRGFPPTQSNLRNVLQNWIDEIE